MASLPPRAASQRRSSPPDQSSPSSAAPLPQEALHRQNSQARSTTSEDSQTVLLNNPDSPSATEASPELQQRQRTTQASTDRIPPEDARKCWICFSDETEDTPLSTEWRSPCPCALTAHEGCLLDWIADMESPATRKRNGPPARILCPQCKSEIHLSRPTSYVVNAVQALERAAGKMVMPAALVATAYTVREGCLMHGIHSVYAVFGDRDGVRILSPLILDAVSPPPLSISAVFSPQTLPEHFWAAVDRLTHHWRLSLGLPLIPPILLLSRTSLADSVLPVLPMLFFATQTHAQHNALDNIGSWPPTAALSFALLPYVRSAYNALYDYVWAEKERKWLREILPRSGPEQGGDAGAGDQAQPADVADDEDDNIFELRVDGDFLEDWGEAGGNDEIEEGEPVPQMIWGMGQDNGDQEAPPFDAPPLADAAPPQEQPAAPPPPPHVHQERRLTISTTHLAETVLGALLFPTISATMGELLRLALPTSWTTPALASWTLRAGSRPGKATGILQERWGRSIVGGCLFVVLKDAVILYVRWKMAMGHRKRKVLDYDKRKGRVVR
ncbi:hypothetical protein B0A49_12679 [Cryomyces minteri]|uniref:RING-CH-type domain-containing protein n=1 Tax=Cryomyces minteri TaxID=331657 RepID=A0A4U0VTU4_9PEZI|nr:hypothetical protein B0A49_12679 [Cryomyces minteri]